MRHSLTIPVEDRLTVPAVFPCAPAFQRMPRVLATAYLVGLVERACIELLNERLGVDQYSVGTHVDVSHDAPTPVGVLVTADVTLQSVRGRRLWFQVMVRDEDDLVAKGRHERVLIDIERFMKGVDRKAARLT